MKIVYLQNDPKHLNSCTFQPSKCANEDCSFVGDRQQIQSHLSECPFQKMICSNCNKTILLREESVSVFKNSRFFNDQTDSGILLEVVMAQVL